MTIETDLKRQMRGDIAHHRQIGTYRGRRHAMGLPVRGQNTQNNAQIAKRLNRLERRWYSGEGVSRSAKLYTWGSTNGVEAVERAVIRRRVHLL